MRRFILPLIGILAAAWAAYAIVHTTTHRESTIPPSPPPVSDFRDTVAAVGLVEASTENIAIGTPLSGIVPKVFVGAGDAVRARDPLFELDTRQLRAELDVRRQTLAVARSHGRVDVAEHGGWRVRAGSAAVGRLRGNAELKTPLSFVRFEPFVVPKKSLTGDSTERVDTRVLQVIYKVEQDDLPLFVGEQLDVFIDAGQVALR